MKKIIILLVLALFGLALVARYEHNRRVNLERNVMKIIEGGYGDFSEKRKFLKIIQTTWNQ